MAVSDRVAKNEIGDFQQHPRRISRGNTEPLKQIRTYLAA
jgi:hypothetical protein